MYNVHEPNLLRLPIARNLRPSSVLKPVMFFFVVQLLFFFSFFCPLCSISFTSMVSFRDFYIKDNPKSGVWIDVNQGKRHSKCQGFRPTIPKEAIVFC